MSRAATRNVWKRGGGDGEKEARGRCFFLFDVKRKCCLDVVSMATSVSCYMSAGETKEKRKNKFQIKRIH